MLRAAASAHWALPDGSPVRLASPLRLRMVGVGQGWDMRSRARIKAGFHRVSVIALDPSEMARVRDLALCSRKWGCM